MRTGTLRDEEIPYFSWDRQLTAGEIKRRLARESGTGWNRLAAWIMREAAFRDVWQFLKPEEVRDHLDGLEPLLGRRKRFWRYIIGVWRELGRI